MKKVITILMISAFMVGCSSHRKKHHDKMWKEMDTDNDNVISEKEFSESKAEFFKKMDANGDGKVTQEEMMDFHKQKKRSCSK